MSSITESLLYMLLPTGGGGLDLFQYVLDNQHDVIYNIVNSTYKVSLGVFYYSGNVNFPNTGLNQNPTLYNSNTDEIGLGLLNNKELYVVITLWENNTPVYLNLLPVWGDQDDWTTFWYSNRQYRYKRNIQTPKAETAQFSQRTFNVYFDLNVQQARVGNIMCDTPAFTFDNNVKYYTLDTSDPSQMPIVRLSSDTDVTENESSRTTYIMPYNAGCLTSKTVNELIEIQTNFTKAVYDANNVAYYDVFVEPTT